jgi:hypothetical protein
LNILCRVLHKEYALEMGPLAYNIALTIQKTSS